MKIIARIVLFAALAGCGPQDAPEDGAPQAPVVVYAAYADKTYLPALFAQYTQRTGVTVIVRNGTSPAIIDDVIENRVDPLADLLLAPSVYDAWRTAEVGELRPNYSATVTDRVAPWLRDPDQGWTAFSYRHAVLVYDPAAIDASDLGAYEDLAGPEFRKKLCLSSSFLPINRAVVAMLIQKLGVRPTELVVRSWVANLAEPVFETEKKLLQGIASGRCAVGIVSSNVAARHANAALDEYTPAEVYSQIEALGVTRHARNPGGAVALIDWLLSDGIQARHAAASKSFAVSPDAAGERNVITVAANDAEAALLAERARYR